MKSYTPEDFIGIEVYDRFTYDDIFRILLSEGLNREEANEYIMYNCELSQIIFEERIYNKYYKRINMEDKISRDLEDLMTEEFYKIIIMKILYYNFMPWIS